MQPKVWWPVKVSKVKKGSDSPQMCQTNHYFLYLNMTWPETMSRFSTFYIQLAHSISSSLFSKNQNERFSTVRISGLLVKLGNIPCVPGMSVCSIKAMAMVGAFSDWTWIFETPMYKNCTKTWSTLKCTVQNDSFTVYLHFHCIFSILTTMYASSKVSRASSKTMWFLPNMFLQSSVVVPKLISTL